VVQVAGGGPADRAGVMIGDVVVRLAGRRVRGVRDLLDALGASGPGPLSLELLRGGQPRVLVVPGEAVDSGRRAA
jgi:S1-C subfamily serine protease